MILAFYKVDNSLGYDRNTFDCVEGRKKIWDMLNKLPNSEFKWYSTDEYSSGSMEPNMAWFEQDYNDELLDGGWWCIVV